MFHKISDKFMNNFFEHNKMRLIVQEGYELIAANTRAKVPYIVVIENKSGDIIRLFRFLFKNGTTSICAQFIEDVHAPGEESATKLMYLTKLVEVLIALAESKIVNGGSSSIELEISSKIALIQNIFLDKKFDMQKRHIGDERNTVIYKGKKEMAFDKE